MGNVIYWRNQAFQSDLISDVTNIAVMVTSACNSDCYHCFRQESKSREKINVQNLKLLAEKIDTSTVKQIHFTGGEPTIINSLDQIMNEYYSVGVNISVASNGYFFSKKLTDRFVSSGISSVTFSAHTNNEYKHDLLTKTGGGFRRLVDAIETAKQAGIFVRINLPVSSLNEESLEETLMWLDALGVDTIKVLRIYPAGNASIEKGLSQMNDRDWDNVYRRLVEIKREIKVPIKMQKRKVCHNGGSDGCTVFPLKHLNIHNNGDIYPCCLLNGMKDYRIGKLSDIFQIGWGRAVKGFSQKILEKERLFNSELLPCLMKIKGAKGGEVCPLHSEEIL